MFSYLPVLLSLAAGPQSVASAEATRAYLQELIRIEEGHRRHSFAGDGAFKATLDKLDQALDLPQASVDPQLLELNRAYRAFIARSRSLFQSEEADLLAAKEHDRQFQERRERVLRAPSDRHPYAAATKDQYNQLWRVFLAQNDSFRSRWAQLQHSLPKRYPELSEELTDLLGPGTFPESTLRALFHQELLPAGTHDPDITARFLAGVLAYYPGTRLQTWFTFLFDDDTTVMDDLRISAGFLQHHHGPHLLPSATAAAHAFQAFLSLGYSIHALQLEGFQWGKNYQREYLPPVPAFAQLTLQANGDLFLRPESQIVPLTEETFRAVHERMRQAINDVLALRPGYRAELAKVFEVYFGEPLDG